MHISLSQDTVLLPETKQRSLKSLTGDEGGTMLRSRLKFRNATSGAILSRMSGQAQIERER